MHENIRKVTDCILQQKQGKVIPKKRFFRQQDIIGWRQRHNNDYQAKDYVESHELLGRSIFENALKLVDAGIVPDCSR